MAIAVKNAFLLRRDCNHSLISPKKKPSAAPRLVKNAGIASLLIHHEG
jgi:hypothetical protein